MQHILTDNIPASVIGRLFYMSVGDVFCNCCLFHHHKPNLRDMPTLISETVMDISCIGVSL